MGKERKYSIVNFIVLFLSCFIFALGYSNPEPNFIQNNMVIIFAYVALIILTHILKQIRIYLEIYGSEISFISNVKVYCKTTFVNIVFPYKLGEIFRMYCYGKLLNSSLKGIIIVLYDRFMDTAALITVIFFVKIIGNDIISNLIYVLLLFLMLMLIIYFTFPNMYKFWNKFLLKSKATKNHIALLKMLYGFNIVYAEIRSISRGRGGIIYILSIIAWGAEIGAVMLMDSLINKGNSYKTIMAYLVSSINMGQVVELIRFRFTSVLLLLVFYLIVKLREILVYRKRMA